jgi:hypothetical protein
MYRCFKQSNYRETRTSRFLCVHFRFYLPSWSTMVLIPMYQHLKLFTFFYFNATSIKKTCEWEKFGTAFANDVETYAIVLLLVAFAFFQKKQAQGHQ